MADMFTNVHCCVQFHRAVLYYVCARGAFRNPLLNQTLWFDKGWYDDR